MTSSAEFNDPRLVAAYDTFNVYEPGTQPDFYLDLAHDAAPRRGYETGTSGPQSRVA